MFFTRALRPSRAERGQASVELVAVLPGVLLLAALLVQLALAGHAAWACANAARVAARAEAVGRDAPAAARSALPRRLERGVSVRREESGLVAVTVRVPLVLPLASAPSVSARARLQETQ